MSNLYPEDTLEAIKMCICPACRAVPFFGANWNLIRVNEDLIYSQCHNCDSAYKFKRREINRIKDSCGWEYTIRTYDNKTYAIRGYSITTKTYRRIAYQYQLITNYYRFEVNEIDDLFKEFINDDKDSIYSFVGRAFKDDERYRNQSQYDHWHNDECLNGSGCLDDDELLAVLDRM